MLFLHSLLNNLLRPETNCKHISALVFYHCETSPKMLALNFNMLHGCTLTCAVIRSSKMTIISFCLHPIVMFVE